MIGHREQRKGKAAGNVARVLPALACLLLGVPGCVPVSVYPLTEAGAGEKDPGLMGDWFHRQGREVLFLHLGVAEETARLRLVMIEYDRQGVLKDSEWTGHISRLDGTGYLNLNPVRPEPETPGYLFVKYRINGNRLCVSLASEEAFEEAIAAGRLRGVLKKDGASSDVLITEESAGLQKFVRENDRKLFPEESCLSRLSLPETAGPKAPGK